MKHAAHCLYCFARAPGDSPGDSSGDSTGNSTCPRCGRRSRAVDRRGHWSLHPQYVAIERTIKVLSVALGALASFACVSAASGPGAGWFFLGPMLLAGGVFATASKITHHAPYFRPTWYWSLLFLVPGILLLAETLRAALPLIALGVLVLWVGRRCEAWKQRLVSGG